MRTHYRPDLLFQALVVIKERRTIPQALWGERSAEKLKDR